MAKHLSTVMHSFPHTDAEASNIQSIEEIYSDLLEFSRYRISTALGWEHFSVNQEI